MFLTPEQWKGFTTDHSHHPVYEGMIPDDWYQKRLPELFLPIEKLREIRQSWEGKGPAEEGVYFLWLGEDLQYVGKSVNIDDRLFQHWQSKAFDHFCFVSVPRLYLAELETKYIRALKPPLNQRHW